MMDLSPIAQAVLVYAVLAVGVAATFLTTGAQVRELWAGLSDRRRSSGRMRRGFLGASIGLGGIAGSILALEVGGPGAIGWMWVASILGMAIIYLEVQVAVRRRRANPGAKTSTAAALGDVSPWLARLFGIAFLVFAIAGGSLLQTQQAGELVSILGGVDERWLVVGLLVGVTAIGVAIPPIRRLMPAISAIAVLLYVLAVEAVLAQTPGVGEALRSIFSGMAGSEQVVGGVAGGGVLMAVQAGFLRATLATEAGLGSAGFSEDADLVDHPERAAATAMLAPLVSGILIPTITALLVMSTSPWTGQRLDEPGERRAMANQREASEAELAEIAASLTNGDVAALREDDRRRTMAGWVSLERPQSRGTVASLQAGQALVLPEDAVGESTPDAPRLQTDHVYPMVMRGSPRGTLFDLKSENDEIILAYAPETAGVTEVVFRDRDPERAKYPAYDLRIPVKQEIAGDEARPFVRLTPVDPEVDLWRLAKVRDGPYVVYSDYTFAGRIVRMFHKQWGAHDAVVAAENEPGRPLSLRMAVSSAFRGPYLDSGEPRPPMAMVGRPEFDAPVGSRIRMAYQTPARGLEIGQLLVTGELVTPPWRFLARTEYAVLRHKEDPDKDLRIRVRHQLVDGRLVFVSDQPEIVDFSTATRWAEFTGPYLDPPPYAFDVEVHTGARAPASTAYLDRHGLTRQSFSGPFTARRTLVPLHPETEPAGSRGELYDPHPAEVAPFMEGPWVVGSGSERLAWAVVDSELAGAPLLMASAVMLLALTTMIGWASHGARAANDVFGRGSAIGFVIVFLLLGLGGASAQLLPVLRMADWAMIPLVILNGVGLVLLARRDRSGTPASDPAE